MLYIVTIILVKNTAQKETSGETDLMIITNIVGIILIIQSNDWIMLIVSWELFNISLYLIVSINYKLSEATLAATLKYFLLSALSTSIFLLGILFLYISTGSTQFDSIAL
jgi:NADH-quinone oxidoreductase subunit N